MKASERPVWAVISDSRDLTEYERICREAVEIGATYLACGGLAEASDSQWDDPEDRYCRYFVNTPSVFKFAEGGAVKDVYPASHIEKNAALLAAKSRILIKHGLQGIWAGQEPMWLPESFFKQNPELRGPRVDHPARSLHERYAPCIDRPEILDAYAGAVQKICQIAPAITAFEFYTNDAGSGICWGEFLYCGQNGPEGCRHIGMGDRVAKFLGAFVRGGKAAGRELKVLMRPKHFSDAETMDYLAKLPPGTGMNYRVFPTKALSAFALDYCLLPEWTESLRKRKRWMFVQYSAQGVVGVRGGMPCPYLLLETLNEYRRHGVHGMTLLSAADMHPSHRWLMKRFPGGLPTEGNRNRAVQQAAAAMYGVARADAVATFWRGVDSALRAWPLHTNGLLFQCSLVERRMLFEPLMVSPKDVPVGPGELWHQGQVHVGPDDKRMDMTWEKGCACGPETWKGLEWLEPRYFEALGHLDRAIRDLRAAVGSKAPKALASEIDHVEIFRCLLATQGNKVHEQALWGRLACLDLEQKVAEADESRYHAQRGLRMVIEREIANTTRLIALLRRHPRALAWAALEEAGSGVGSGVIAKLRHKISLMRDNLKKQAAGE